MPDSGRVMDPAARLTHDVKKLLSWYDAGRVQRYHVVPDYTGAPRQNLAEHQWGVAMFVRAICERMGDQPSAPLLLAALTHDIPERWLGDMPANVKWAHPALALEYRKAEDIVERSCGTRVQLTAGEETILKWADGLECLVYSKRRGGPYMEAYWNIVEYFAVKKKAPHLPEAYELMQEIMRYI